MSRPTDPRELLPAHLVSQVRTAHHPCYQLRLRGVLTMMQPPGMGIMRKLLSSSEGRSSSMTGSRLIARSTGGGNGRVMTARQRHDHAHRVPAGAPRHGPPFARPLRSAGVLIVKTGVSPVPSGSLRSGFQVCGHDFGCIGVCLSAAKSVLLSAVKLPAAGHVQLVHDAEGWMC
jgi:hypothetical protein